MKTAATEGAEAKREAAATSLHRRLWAARAPPRDRRSCCACRTRRGERRGGRERRRRGGAAEGAGAQQATSATGNESSLLVCASYVTERGTVRQPCVGCTLNQPRWSSRPEPSSASCVIGQLTSALEVERLRARCGVDQRAALLVKGDQVVPGGADAVARRARRPQTPEQVRRPARRPAAEGRRRPTRSRSRQRRRWEEGRSAMLQLCSSGSVLSKRPIAPPSCISICTAARAPHVGRAGEAARHRRVPRL